MSESLAGYVVDDFDETPSPALDRLARATHAVVHGLVGDSLEDIDTSPRQPQATVRPHRNGGTDQQETAP